MNYLLKALTLILSISSAFSHVGHCTFYGAKWFNQDPYTYGDGTAACWKTKDRNTFCPNNFCFREIGPPYMIAAMSNPPKTNTQDCGKCFQVKCIDGQLRGTSNSSLWRGQVCKDKNRQVEVMITDSCAPDHPNPSNAIWCRTPREHLDLSYQAFEQLVDPRHGVFDAEIHEVPCKASYVYGVQAEKCRMRRDEL